jgi:hypothetical protein
VGQLMMEWQQARERWVLTEAMQLHYQLYY